VLTFLFISSEKASPLTLLAYKPAFVLLSKAAELYQPGAVLPAVGGFSKIRQ
jgi:hypothetical protein